MDLTRQVIEQRLQTSRSNGWLAEALHEERLLKSLEVDVTTLGASPSEALRVIDLFPYYVDERDFREAEDILERMEDKFRPFLGELDQPRVSLVTAAREYWDQARASLASGDLANALACLDSMEKDGWLKGEVLLERRRVATRKELADITVRTNSSRTDPSEQWRSDQVTSLCKYYDQASAVNTWQDNAIAGAKQQLLDNLRKEATDGLIILVTEMLGRDAFREARESVDAFATAQAIDHKSTAQQHKCAMAEGEFLQAMRNATGQMADRDFAKALGELAVAHGHNPWSQAAAAKKADCKKLVTEQHALLDELASLKTQCSVKFGDHAFGDALSIAKCYAQKCREPDTARLLAPGEIAVHIANARTLVRHCRKRRLVYYGTLEFLIDRLLEKVAAPPPPPPPVEKVVAPPPPAVEAPPPQVVEEEVAPDDLMTIQGIGPTMQKRLNEGGIRTYAQLAQSTADELRELLGDIGRLAKVEWWIEQAQDLIRSA